MATEIYRLKVEELSKEIWDKINNNEFKIVDGVVRTVKGNSIKKHIPHELVKIPDNEDLQAVSQQILAHVDKAQMAMIGTTALATTAIIGAIIVSTIYLSKKIDKLQAKVDKILKELHDQNFIHYFEKVVYFFGEIESLREIISNREVLLENKDLVLMKLNEISTSRNQHLLFVDNIIFQIENKSPKHQDLLLDTINTFLEIMPKAAFVESQAAYKIDRFLLGDNTRQSFLNSYDRVLNKYRSWCNDIVRLDRFNPTRTSLTEKILDKDDAIRSLINSTENRLLLENSI